MEFEAEWLLVLPLFFALGWFAAQWDSKKRLQESKKLPKSYFKGLNHLLDQEPDKAIDALIDVARVDTGTVDLYFALGNLFSQRGEVERSIRVYQSLIDRPDLSPAPRQSATYKLGMAFLSGGLFDRAEQCFQELIGTEREHEARVQLLHIYQSQQEWHQAIDMAQAINQTAQTAGQQTTALTHFHCELALAALRAKDWLQAQHEIDAALSQNPKSVRALLLKGQWYAEQGRHDEALHIWQTLASEQPESVPLLVNDMMKSYVAANRAQDGLADLHQKVLDSGSIDVLDAWLKARDQYGMAEQTLAQLHELFMRHPSLNALNKLLDARIRAENGGMNKADNTGTTPVGAENAVSEESLTRGLIQKYVKQLSRYRCTQCGFEAANYYWQCPACTRWESYPPKRLEELQNIKRSRNDVNSYY